MTTISDLITTGASLHQAGRLAAAEVLYRQVLCVEPNEPRALHLLGLIAMQRGNYEVAVSEISCAIAAEPDFAEAHYHLGIALKMQGRLDEAIASYNRALEVNPDFAEA